MNKYRLGPGVFLLIAILLLPMSYAQAQSGTITRVFKKTRAKVKWDFLGARADQIGVLVEVNVAVGLFRVLESEGLKGTVELIDEPFPGVFAKKRRLHTVEISMPTASPNKARVLVWSPQIGAPLMVDGEEAGTIPGYVQLSPGTHEVVVKLARGGHPGARLEVNGQMEEILFLQGFQREITPQWNPLFLFEGFDSRGVPKERAQKERTFLQWIDEPGGTRVYRGGGSFENAVITKRVEPVYPPVAHRARIEGRVALEAIIGTDGQIHDARVIASYNEMFDWAALKAVRQWAYEPGILDGSPVPFVFTIFMHFYLTR